MIKAADMMIARRADTKARADFATWKMMAKLNGASALPAEAETFLVSYKDLLTQKTEPEATEATIQLMYRAYYAEMGGHGIAPDVRAQMSEPVTGNVTAFKRPTPQNAKPGIGSKAGFKTGFRAGFKAGPDGKPKLPVALIFACLVVVYVGFRYYWR